MSTQYEPGFYKRHALTCDPKDFWGQVRRTVNGKPVPPEQINMIVEAVVTGLSLQPDDALLDLCCGNGALSTLFFSHCASGLGVDYSEALIKVALENFHTPPATAYLLDDVVEYAAQETEPDRFTKAVCYGSVQSMDLPTAGTFLSLLRQRFVRIERLFIGNHPDGDHVHHFFRDRAYEPGIENDPNSPIGIWRTRDEFRLLATRAGWTTTFSRMPEGFYGSHYRYDALLTPLSEGV